MNDKQTIDELIQEYGGRLAELEGMFYSAYGFYPSFDCGDFWEDRAVSEVETLLEFWWEVKRTLISKEPQ